ncbi:MAG: hypothetical protein KAV87_32275, partial [Desulfobacteraceae bacterium]|nr:hypothetical protein [Desulfobacteraceae bacterium]
MKRLTAILSILMALSILLGACAAPTEAPEEAAPTEVIAAPTAEEEVAPPEEEPFDPATVAAALPRNETMYF